MPPPIQYNLIGLLLLLSRPLVSQDSLATKEIAAALSLLNEARRSAGLDTVAMAETISAGCRKHAKYLVMNRHSSRVDGLAAHQEFPDLPGFSKAGQTAGQNSVIHYVRPSAAVPGWVASFYHRVPLLQPNLKQIGIGYYEADGYPVTLVDCISGLVGESPKAVVCYPSENQTGIPLAMGPELPHPVGEEGTFGFPITIFFANQQQVSKVNFKLTTQKGNPISCYLSTPEAPATDFDQWDTICAIPKRPLQPGATYTVALSCEVDGVPYSKTYLFTTTHQ